MLFARSVGDDLSSLGALGKRDRVRAYNLVKRRVWIPVAMTTVG